ncbi:MAG: NUDIX hydrolase [Oscillospiraceae bacterium]|nr:NUDIX hydrolase [Oscillospiraceae bacterium]MBR3475477.1 NUDIX hydrolase [Oscillospiraceae bacterium]
MQMSYCPVCGEKLSLRPHPTEPPTLWCRRCEDWRFPLFSAAVSVILLDQSRERMLLIRQYGEPDPVLPAGYVDKGETAEAAVVREIREELGMTALSPRFLGSHYYAPSETLMLNFLAVAAEDEARPNAEVDGWEWVPAKEARSRVKPGGLAEVLLADWDGA